MGDPWLGQRLGNYQIDALLGRGGMASVYRATHVALGTSHAVKVLKDTFAQHPDVKARFLREGRVQAQFRHPGIAQVTDTIASPGVALVMELLAGESLRQVVERGPISLEAAAMIVEDVASALAYAHGLGVVHRDIKPDNIFLAEESEGALRPVVLDFGVARVDEMTTLTQTGILIGTPRYMSPEQFEDPRSVDGRSDVFSLAIVLFEMIAGFTPHPGESPPVIAMSMMNGRFDRISKCSEAPESLDAVMRRALQPEPSDRYDDIEAFAAAVRQALPDDGALYDTVEPIEPAHDEPAHIEPRTSRGEPPRSPPSGTYPGLRSTLDPMTPVPAPTPDATGAPRPRRGPLASGMGFAPTWPPIPDAEVAAVLADRATGASTVACVQCGAANRPDRPRCRRCGTELPSGL